MEAGRETRMEGVWRGEGVEGNMKEGDGAGGRTVRTWGRNAN